MKMSEQLSSGECIDALESAIRALPGGHDAVEAAVEFIISERDK